VLSPIRARLHRPWHVADEGDVLRDSLFGTYVTVHRLRACLISFCGGNKRVFVVLKSSSTLSGGGLQSARAQVVQLAPNVWNRKVLRVFGKRGLPLKDAAPLA
jgi:hypothetical protein